MHRHYERVKESVSRISTPNQYKVQDSATGIKQDCKPVLKVVTKCERFAKTGIKIMQQMRDNHGNVVSINKSDLEKLFLVFNAQCEYLKSEYASLVVKSNFNDETPRLLRSFENNSAAFSDESLRNVRIAAELAAVQNRFSTDQEGDIAEVHKVSHTAST